MREEWGSSGRMVGPLSKSPQKASPMLPSASKLRGKQPQARVWNKKAFRKSHKRYPEPRISGYTWFSEGTETLFCTKPEQKGGPRLSKKHFRPQDCIKKERPRHSKCAQPAPHGRPQNIYSCQHSGRAPTVDETPFRHHLKSNKKRSLKP